MLAEWHQQAIDFDPIAAWQFGFQRERRPLWSGRGHVAPAIRDAVNVDIHSNARLAAGNTHHQVGALGSHARQRQQHLLITRKFPTIFIPHATRDLMDLLSLTFVKRTGTDDVANFGGCESADGLRGAGDPKETARRWQHHFIVGPDRNNASHQHLEGCGETTRKQFEQCRFWEWLYRYPNAIHYHCNIKRFLGHTQPNQNCRQNGISFWRHPPDRVVARRLLLRLLCEQIGQTFNELERYWKQDRRVFLDGDLSQRLQVTQLNRGRLLADQ